MAEALLVVDVQNDFMPTGSLPVPDGDAVVPVANALMELLDHVIASQDWHPRDHVSFATNHRGASPGDVIDLGGMPQVLWPPHCVQGTTGADFHPELAAHRIDQGVLKGTDPAVDSYSAFFDNARQRTTGLEAVLRNRGVTGIVIVGVATDYCVKHTALDAVLLGFAVRVVLEGCRAVDLAPGDGEQALREMEDAGCRIVRLAEVVRDVGRQGRTSST